MPIVNAINDILTKKADINEVIKNLLTRPITNEF
jgi:glycerol-3-phosphate dehydrogenase